MLAPSTGLFLVTQASLIGVPIGALIAQCVVSRQSLNFKRRFYGASAAFGVAVVAAAVLGITFTLQALNAAALSATYFVFALLAFAAFTVRPRWLGIVIGLVSTLPMLLGLVLATIGLFALVFVVSESIPDYEGKTQSGAKCHIHTYGGPIPDYGQGGRIVKVYRPLMLGLERRVASTRLPEEQSSGAALCAKAELHNAG